MRYLIICCSVLFALSLTAQTEADRHVMQFSGLVLTGDSLNPVAYTTVYRARDQRGTITDNVGFFSIPAFAGDTIHFSCIGYLPAHYVIPDSLAEARYNMVQVLRRDTIQLETTFIYPWPTKERFRQEFLALELPDTKEDLARRNLEASKLYEKMNYMEPSAREAYHYAMLQNTRQITYAGQIPTISLMNPIAWAQFIDAWRSGAYRKQ